MKRNHVALVLLLVFLAVLIAAIYWYQEGSTVTQTTSVSSPARSSGTSSSSESISCPDMYKGQMLASYGIYDGKPSELADLEPSLNKDGTSSWDLTYPSTSDEGYYLGCVYAGTSTPQFSEKLDSTIKSCTLAGPNKIICS